MIHKLLHEIKCNIFDCFAKKSYSQDGEDMILREKLLSQKKGFYIDVGAHHPMRFSNTYYYYKKGWQGINIDAMPGSMKSFRRLRRRDINLELAVSDSCQELIYYMFNEPALNSFDACLSQNREGDGRYKIIETKKITTKTLANILDEILPYDQIIDILSVDVEGLDLNVLRSNNWSKHRPKFVLAECHVGESLLNIHKDEIYIYLQKQGYSLIAKTLRTAIFEESK